MAAKRIQVSSDNGSTWLTLPGNTGEFSNEANEIEDTIFGQSFASSETGLIAGTISSNALYKGFAGYHADLQLMSGSSTTFTTEGMTLVTGKTYRITDATKNVWDLTAAVTVFDNAVDETDNVESIDFLYGKITFQSGYTPSGPITVTGKYFTKTTIAKGKSFNLTQSMAPIDDTDFVTAQANGGRNTYEYGLKTVQLEVGGIYDSTNGWLDAIAARNRLIIEIAPVGNAGSESRCRGFFKVNRQSQSGDVGALEEETINFTLAVPQQTDVATTGGFDNELLLTPFRWDHPSGTKLNSAVIAVLNAWEGDLKIDVRYLSDGTNGQRADAVVAEASLTGGLEAINEFACTFNIDGALTAVP